MPVSESAARREQRKAAVVQKESFRGLTQHPGWEKLREIVAAQVSARVGSILYHPLTDVGSVLAQEYMKGEIQGLRLVLELPEQQLSEAEAVLSTLGLKDDEDD